MMLLFDQDFRLKFVSKELNRSRYCSKRRIIRTFFITVCLALYPIFLFRFWSLIICTTLSAASVISRIHRGYMKVFKWYNHYTNSYQKSVILPSPFLLKATRTLAPIFMRFKVSFMSLRSSPFTKLAIAVLAPLSRT